MNLEKFLEMGPIAINSIPGLMGLTLEESDSLISELLKKKNKYTMVQNGSQRYLSLRE